MGNSKRLVIILSSQTASSNSGELAFNALDALETSRHRLM